MYTIELVFEVYLSNNSFDFIRKSLPDCPVPIIKAEMVNTVSNMTDILTKTQAEELAKIFIDEYTGRKTDNYTIEKVEYIGIKSAYKQEN